MRADINPSEGIYWYQREVNFFDVYVIPLGQTTRHAWLCFGTFGGRVSTECRTKPRGVGLERGHDIVEKMLAGAERPHGSPSDGNHGLQALSTRNGLAATIDHDCVGLESKDL